MKVGLLATSGLMLVLPAWAGAHAQAAAEPASPAPVQREADDDNTIVVTGSRLSQTALTSNVPVLIADSEDIAVSGQENAADFLTDLPSVGIGFNDSNSQRVATGVGLNLVNLRRLGTGRTLVLVNGRRQVAGTPLSAAVDLNSIPAALINRVEVVTGGASAVYGADAVSGVINILLKDDFEGLEARVRGGITSRGDGESYGISLTAGQNFADDRGNLVVNFFYDNVQGVEAADRRWGVSGFNTIRNPDDVAANDGIPNFIQSPDIRFNGPNQLGVVFLDSGTFVVNPGGATVRPYDFGAIGDRGGRSIGGDGGFFERYDNLTLPIERYALSANLNYELAENVNFFFEGRYVKSSVQSFWQPVADDFSYAAPFITLDNPFVPADLAALVQAEGGTGFPFFRVYDDFGRRGSDAERNQQQYTLGLNGRVFDGWSYSVFAGYGSNSSSVRLLNGRQQDRWLESVDVILLNGQPACRSADARARGCQPLNPFNPAATPAGIEYSRVDDSYFSRASLRMVGASLTGELFQLPAGPVETAIGVEARENTARTQPSDALQSGRIYYPQEAPVSGSIRVKEAFGEIRVPLLRDMLLVNELTVQAAARISDYNNNGTQTSWNVGGAYSPVEGLRFRAMRSKSVRAPNIGDLFSPLNESFFFVQDPCDISVVGLSPNRAQNCQGLGLPAVFNAPTNGRTTRARIGGNPALDPETARTWTFGLTFVPTFVPGLTLSLDYFDIKIADAIGNIPVGSILNNCVDLPLAPSENPLCALITRDPATGGVTNIEATAVNIGRLETRGVDFTLDYRFRLATISQGLPGALSLSVTGTYLDRLREFTDANNPQSENKSEGYLGSPEWEVLGTATYSIDSLAITWRSHLYSSMSILGSVNLAAGIPSDQFDLPNTGTRVFHDLSVSYDVTEQLNARLNINNIFDSRPPNRGFNVHQGINEASLYPNIGTTFSFALTYRM